MTDRSLYRGKVNRVPSRNSVEVDLDLTLGVTIRKVVVVDGLGDHVTGDNWSGAQHCLVILCGGEMVYIITDPGRIDGHLPARLLVPRWMAPSSALAHCVMTPEVLPGLPMPAIDVLLCMSWAAGTGFDAPRLRAALKGK